MQQASMWRTTLAALLSVSAFAAAAPTKQWSVVELTPDSPGGGSASDVNNRGDVVGQTLRQTGPLPFGFTPTAYVWRNGVREDIGSGAGRSSVASAINDKGTIVGAVDGTAYMWKDGVATSLHIAGNAVDINKGEQIAGTYWTGGAIGSGQERPFVMRDGVLFELPMLGTSGAGVGALNDKGVVVGYGLAPATSTTHAVLWQDLAIRDLGTLGGRDSFADRINNHGVIVGRSQDASGARFMARWNVGGGPIEKLQAGFVPFGINDHGAIVGSDQNTGIAFLYEDGVVTNLLELPAMKAGGWKAFTPRAINDHGWIVGTAWKPGVAFWGTAVLLMPD